MCVWPEQKAEASAYGQLTARCENITIVCELMMVAFILCNLQCVFTSMK